MDIHQLLSEVVVSVIDNQNGTSTVIYKNGNRTRIEYKQTRDALELARKCDELDIEKREFEKRNGRLRGIEGELLLRLEENERAKQIRRKLVGK